MTTLEANNLDLNEIYDFSFYHGDRVIGLLALDEQHYYIIESKNISEFVHKDLKPSSIGLKINIETICHYNIFSSESKETESRIHITETVNASKLVILGAGASFDFTFDNLFEEELKPPLTYNLFDDLYIDILNKYPGAKALSGAAIQAENIEVFFQRQWERIKKHYHPELLRKIINTQFYLKHLFISISLKCRGVRKNNYNSLIALINNYCVEKKEQVLITSFNYDFILEQSITAELDYDYKSIEDYINSSRKILLYKPHGSCNWGRFSNEQSGIGLIPKHLVAADLYENKRNYFEIFKQLNEDIHIISEDILEERTIENANYFPQLLIPFTDKDEFVMPNEHTESLRNNLRKIDEILIIGWKGTEYEYMDLLSQSISNSGIKITIVNNGDASIKSIFNDRINGIQWIEKTTFSEFMKAKNNLNENIF